MDRGAWKAMVHGGLKELDMTEWLTYKHDCKNLEISRDFPGGPVVNSLSSQCRGQRLGN